MIAFASWFPKRKWVRESTPDWPRSSQRNWRFLWTGWRSRTPVRARGRTSIGGPLGASLFMLSTTRCAELPPRCGRCCAPKPRYALVSHPRTWSHTTGGLRSSAVRRKENCELPAFSTLDLLVRRLRNLAHQRIFQTVLARLTEAEQALLENLVETNPT